MRRENEARRRGVEKSRRENVLLDSSPTRLLDSDKEGMMPPELLISGVGITVLVPALVELAKRSGMPTRLAGLASIVAAGLVLGLVQLQSNEQFGGAAGWLLLSLVYGLAAAGFYSQVRKLSDGQ